MAPRPRRPAFTETKTYEPNSPYSASKAASDHLVRAWHHTYGLPVTTSNCSNNYGPYHFPEKLIPLMIANALAGKPLPGVWRRPADPRLAVRHRPLQRHPRHPLATGKPGEVYNVGGWNEKPNIEIVAPSARSSTNSSPTPPAATRGSSPSSPTAPATTAATPSTPARSSANSAGARRNLRNRHPQDRRMVSRPPGLGRPRPERRLPRMGREELRRPQLNGERLREGPCWGDFSRPQPAASPVQARPDLPHSPTAPTQPTP